MNPDASRDASASRGLSFSAAVSDVIAWSRLSRAHWSCAVARNAATCESIAAAPPGPAGALGAPAVGAGGGSGCGAAVVAGGGVAALDDAGGAAGDEAAGIVGSALSAAAAEGAPVGTSLDPERHFITPKIAMA